MKARGAATRSVGSSDLPFVSHRPPTFAPDFAPKAAPDSYIPLIILTTEISVGRSQRCGLQGGWEIRGMKTTKITWMAQGLMFLLQA